MTTRFSDLANVIRIEADLPVGFATAGTTGEEPIGRAELACKVTAVRFIPKTAITANGTHYATLSIQNTELDGAAGDVEVASFAFDTPTTDDVAAYDEKALTLHGTLANITLAIGEVLTLKKAVTGNGIALDGKVIIEAAPLQ